MKKFIALLLVTIMLLSLTACGSSSGNSASSGKVYKVGMITDVAGVNDKGFNQTAWEGLQALSVEDSSFQVSYLESNTDADYAANIETFLDEGYDLILCVGYMQATALRAAAEANPEQLFAIIDDTSITDLPNVAALSFAQAQPSYLVGVVAGLATKTNVVGYVQGMLSDTMNQFCVGYIAGVLSVNPDATVLQYNANSFSDMAGGKAAATNMITNGADVIFHAAGATGLGVIDACAEANVYAIGVDTDQSVIDPVHVITSAMKRVDVAAQEVAKSVKDGTFTPGLQMYDLRNGAVDIAPTRDLLTAEMLEAVEAAKAAILDGSVTVPTTPDELGGLFTLAS